jgi:hypothetical protein
MHMWFLASLPEEETWSMKWSFSFSIISHYLPENDLIFDSSKFNSIHFVNHFDYLNVIIDSFVFLCQQDFRLFFITKMEAFTPYGEVNSPSSGEFIFIF